MKIILGDNQFFGVNHNDIEKGDKTKKMFPDSISIRKFIHKSIKIGIDGFMINSNSLGYKLVSNYKKIYDEEIHYSIPYPHKYANMVNENGILSLITFFLKNASLKNILINIPKFIITKKIDYLIPLAVDLEVPKCLPKGSIIFLQNIITDLTIGLNKPELLERFLNSVHSKGYRAGLITLNPIKLEEIIEKSSTLNNKNLIVCFNINNIGFNVFPDLKKVEKYISKPKKYKKMGMSIFSSGGSDIQNSINYIKSLKLDYVVFGSSNISNIESNYKGLKSK